MIQRECVGLCGPQHAATFLTGRFEETAEITQIRTKAARKAGPRSLGPGHEAALHIRHIWTVPSDEGKKMAAGASVAEVVWLHRRVSESPAALFSYACGWSNMVI